MGAYSEIDLERQDNDNPFEESSSIPDCVGAENISDFAEEAPVEQDVALSAAPAEAQPQQDTNLDPAEPAETDDAPAQAPNDSGQAASPAGDTANEEEKKKAHEAAEAKRKADWEARQAVKKAAEQEQLDRLAAMSDDEVMAVSMKRVSTDTEKLTRRSMKECVAEYIQTMCIEDPAFARKTMHPRKNMIRCFQYINRKAWDYIQDELKANGIQPGPGQQMYGSDIPDDLCYQWAMDYFNDPDAKEDHEEEEKFVPKPYVGGTTTKRKSSKSAKKKTEDKKVTTPKQPAESTGQLSLGDFVMPEEKAG